MKIQNWTHLLKVITAQKMKFSIEQLKTSDLVTFTE